MLTIDGIRAANDSRLGRRRREERPDDAEFDAAEPESRALVLVGPVVASEHRREHSHRAAPDFLAHLAATRQRAPQTRAVRRAEPAEAVAAYGSMLVTPASAGRVLRRSV